jgi:hypothetical protein
VGHTFWKHLEAHHPKETRNSFTLSKLREDKEEHIPSRISVRFPASASASQIKRHAGKCVGGGMELNFCHSERRRWMQRCGQLHVPAALLPVKELEAQHGWEAGWVLCRVSNTCCPSLYPMSYPGSSSAGASLNYPPHGPVGFFFRIYNSSESKKRFQICVKS